MECSGCDEMGGASPLAMSAADSRVDAEGEEEQEGYRTAGCMTESSSMS